MATPWRPKIDIIAEGEQVSAAITDRPILQLAGQTQHLKEQLSKLGTTSGRLIFAGATLDSSVELYDFVYFDSNDACFKQALAETVQDNSGQYLAGPRSFAVGMVITKSSSTSGDVMQIGRINLADEAIDPNNLVETPDIDPFVPGRYFLSNRFPGKITRHLRMPNIQLGFFTTTECHIQPLQKDLFESHYHYKFALLAKPAASQNYAQTGWTSFGASGPNDNKRVDYYNSGATATPPPIILCVRPNGLPSIDPDHPVRVELYNDTGKLRANLVNTSVDFATPTSGTSSALAALVDWPTWGQWITIDNTNLQVAFIRADANYSATLASDAATFLTSTTQRFKIYLPTDLTGWTNANPWDLVTPVGVLYRYLSESDTPLNNAFPPVPVESATIEINGTTLVPGQDFKVSQFGIFWVPGGVATAGSPWPSDYSTVASMDVGNARNLTIYFTKASLSNSRSVVFSLKGIAPIVVSECPTGDPASSGNLQVGIDLNMGVSSDAPITSDTALVSVAGVEFQRGNMVAELVEGTGIQIDRLSTTGPLNIGRLRISARDARFEGEFSSIALRNAKEVVSNLVSYVDFLPPLTAPTGITASFKIPNVDFDPSILKLKIFGTFRGDSMVAGSDQTAIFKVVYHVLRPGFAMSALNDGTAVAVQYWKIPFTTGYLPGTLLAPEYPYAADNVNLFQIDSLTLVANPNSLVALSGGFLLGDMFSIQIDRVRTDAGSNPDNYSGRVGILGLRWLLV